MEGLESLEPELGTTTRGSGRNGSEDSLINETEEDGMVDQHMRCSNKVKTVLLAEMNSHKNRDKRFSGCEKIRCKNRPWSEMCLR